MMSLPWTRPSGPGPTPTRRPGAPSVLLLAALLLGLAACEEEAPAPDAAAAPPPPMVTVGTIAPAEVPLTFGYAGRVAGFRVVEVRPQVGGILLERAYREGDDVEQGELLFRIDPRPFEVALARAQAQLQQAQAQLRQADDNYARQQELFQRRVASERQRDDAIAERDLARAAVAAAEAEIAAARLNLDFTEVNAPMAGVTSLQSPPVGTLVQAQQTLLTTIIRLDPAYVTFSYTDAENAAFRALNAARAEPIAPTDLTLSLRFGDGSVYPHKGRMDTAAHSVDLQTGTIQARAIFPNPDGILLPGQFVRIIVEGVSLQAALTIPKEAVSQGPQGPFVYVVGGDERAAVRPIRLGRELDTAWVVQEGLRPGDRIVTDGVIRVRPGGAVRVAERPASQPAAETAAAAEGGSR